MKVRFHPAAREEALAAAEYYETRRAGLGAAFVFELEATIQRITETPQRWRIIDKGIRLCRTRTFPYAVLYSLEPEGILILAVMHLHRAPGYWRDRATEPGA